MEVRDDDDLPAPFKRPPVGAAHDLSCVIDGELRASSHDLNQVRVDPREGPATRGAVATTTIRAKQRRSESAHELLLLEPARPYEKVRMYWSPRCYDELIDYLILPDDIREERR
jgi:hypothetical protein